MKQITIVDIAQKLNLTPSTVSRALRGHPDVNEATRRRILALADELDYHPNVIAQSLKKRRTNLIGVIVPQFRHYFFSAVMAGVTDVTEKAGYTIMVCHSNEEMEREASNIRTLISQHVAGLLISVSKTTVRFDHFESLQRRKIPMVFFDRTWNNPKASKVIVDDYEGALQAVKHLISQGYKKIAHLAGPDNLSICELRLKGYLDALKDHGMPVRNDYIVRGGLNEEDGKQEIEQLLQLPLAERPDAIFAVTDPVAIGAFIKIKAQKLKIPGDIALVGFSDNPEASLIEPPLTTVRQPAYELGKEATKILMHHINDADMQPVNKILKTELIIREST
jgi:DNA-binding LacI/PurR family transcriptional regulator